MMSKLQMKAGAPITLLQFILGVVTLLLVQGGTYISSIKTEAAEHQRTEDRLKILEDYKAASMIRLTARQLADKEKEQKDIKQDQDIEIIKATKKDK